ncbi:MAG TPA: alginate lyase family protein [Polyangiaceae bacterium]
MGSRAPGALVFRSAGFAAFGALVAACGKSASDGASATAGGTGASASGSSAGGGTGTASGNGGATSGPGGTGGAGASGGGQASSGGTGAAGGAGGIAGTGGALVCNQPGALSEVEAFVHPGGLHKRSDFDRMRYMVEAGVEPWATAFEELADHSAASFDYDVRGEPGVTVVSRDGEQTNRSAFESDVTAAYLNALMWAIGGDERHAEKAVEIFNTWKTLTEVTGGGTEALNGGLYAWKLAEAAEIIKSSYDGWSASDVQEFSDMLVYPGYSSSAVPASVTANNGTFYWRIHNGDPGRHGNQDLIAWRAMITMGVFLDNRIMFERALRYFKGEPHRPDDLPYASGPTPSGAEIDDNEYFTTYQYGGMQSTTPDYGYNGVLEHYVWETGQSQESSRDQQHAFFGLGICAGIAEVAWNQGDAVYNALDDRLLEGFEFSGRYNASLIASFPDQTTPWEPSGAEFVERLDRSGRWLSKAVNPYFDNDFVELSRGDFPGKRPVFEQPLAHFQVRMGRSSEETLWTERARDVSIEQGGYEGVGFNLDHPGWGALTFRRPLWCAGDPVSGFADGLPVFAVHVLPGAIPAVNYDHFPISGEGRTYHDLSEGNSGGQYRSDDVDIGCGPGSELVLTELEAGEWFTYTVYVPESADYTLGVRYFASADGGSLRFAFAGADVAADVALASTSGAEASVELGGASLEAGVQALRVFVSGASSVLELREISVGAQ